jgi:CO/xanthine dehydrogenase FAD-binding subunit
MAAHNQTHNQVLRPHTLQELFSLWIRFPNAVPFSGGTSIIRNGLAPGGHGVLREQLELPGVILSLERIADLRAITRTERYLEIGAAVRLSEIIALGKIVPGIFSQVILGIASPQLRNMATIGGNICTAGDTIAPLCALDAVYELRGSAGSRWISAARFSSGAAAFQTGELLTRIRVPLEEWDYNVYRKFTTCDSDGPGGVLVLVVRNQKNILAKLQAVFAGMDNTLLRNKDSEALLEGKTLPLERRNLVQYRKHWENYLEGLPKPGKMLKDKIINSIETGIIGLSD